MTAAIHRAARRTAAALLAVAALAALGGYMHGTRANTPAPSPGPVNVSIVYEESGDARSIDLTDSNGDPVEVGSVAEEFPWLEEEVDAP